MDWVAIQSPRKRKGIIDFDRLMGLLGFDNYNDLKDAHDKWVNSAMRTENRGNEIWWTESMLVAGAKRLLRRWKKPLDLGQKVES